MTSEAPTQSMVATLVEGMRVLDRELNACQVKAGKLETLTKSIITDSPPEDRNDVLAAFMVIKSCQATVNRLKEKQLAPVKELIQAKILAMLASEDLDNFSHAGKLFYPSSTTRFNVADRERLEEGLISKMKQSNPWFQDPQTEPFFDTVIATSLKELFEMFGNSLNSELIRQLQEQSSVEVVDETTGEKTIHLGPPPQGVGTHITTTLNMRSKK